MSGSYVISKEDLTPGLLVSHFKSELDNKPRIYRIAGIAENTETGEELVIYSDIHTAKTWARPLTSFLSEVDHDKYYRSTWKYKFKTLA